MAGSQGVWQEGPSPGHRRQGRGAGVGSWAHCLMSRGGTPILLGVLLWEGPSGGAEVVPLRQDWWLRLTVLPTHLRSLGACTQPITCCRALPGQGLAAVTCVSSTGGRRKVTLGLHVWLRCCPLESWGHSASQLTLGSQIGVWLLAGWPEAPGRAWVCCLAHLVGEARGASPELSLPVCGRDPARPFPGQFWGVPWPPNCGRGGRGRPWALAVGVLGGGAPLARSGPFSCGEDVGSGGVLELTLD